MAIMMAYNNLVYVDCFCIIGDSFLHKYAIGWWCWLKIAPIPLLEAFVSIMKIYEKFGSARIGVVEINCFKCSKTTIATWSHLNYLSSRVRGATIQAYPLINLL